VNSNAPGHRQGCSPGLGQHITQQKLTPHKFLSDQKNKTFRGARILGVDDWAWRKGQSYGTILVDLESRAPLDLLPDRSADSLATWLQSHPGAEVISRDRGGIYADGALVEPRKRFK
jgi:transposase